jgi:hypothetical protein
MLRVQPYATAMHHRAVPFIASIREPTLQQWAASDHDKEHLTLWAKGCFLICSRLCPF